MGEGNEEVVGGSGIYVIYGVDECTLNSSPSLPLSMYSWNDPSESFVRTRRPGAPYARPTINQRQEPGVTYAG